MAGLAKRKQRAGKSVREVVDFSGFSRSELVSAAKAAGIKANLKSVEIVELLRAV